MLLKLFYISLAESYKVVVWTTDKELAATDGNVYIKFVGDVCMTAWHYLDRPWVDDFIRGSGDSFKFTDYDIGSEVN